MTGRGPVVPLHGSPQRVPGFESSRKDEPRIPGRQK